MDAEFQLATRYEVGFTVWNDACLFDRVQSFKFIEACKAESAPILGIESYISKGGNYLLQQDNIADFSSLINNGKEAFADNTCRNAAIFIEQVHESNTLFEFVLGNF